MRTIVFFCCLLALSLITWGVCESVQRGMTSRYFRGGWYAPMEDTSLDIRRWLLARLQ